MLGPYGPSISEARWRPHPLGLNTQGQACPLSHRRGGFLRDDDFTGTEGVALGLTLLGLNTQGQAAPLQMEERNLERGADATVAHANRVHSPALLDRGSPGGRLRRPREKNNAEQRLFPGCAEKTTWDNPGVTDTDSLPRNEEEPIRTRRHGRERRSTEVRGRGHASTLHHKAHEEGALCGGEV